MAKELTCSGVIVLDGVKKDFETLTDSELNTVESLWRSRLSGSMSRYYSAHGEEFEKIFRKAEKRTV